MSTSRTSWDGVGSAVLHILAPPSPLKSSIADRVCNFERRFKMTPTLGTNADPNLHAPTQSLSDPMLPESHSNCMPICVACPRAQSVHFHYTSMASMGSKGFQLCHLWVFSPAPGSRSLEPHALGAAEAAGGSVGWELVTTSRCFIVEVSSLKR